MENSKILDRATRIRMFILEYYLGGKLWIRIFRFIGGPLMIFLGWQLYNLRDRFEIGYGGFCIVYGLYYILKPIFWVLLRLSSFKTTPVSIEVTEDKLKLRDSISNSEVLFSGMKSVLKRKTYYVFEISPAQRIHLPLNFFSQEQQSSIDKWVK